MLFSHGVMMALVHYGDFAVVDFISIERDLRDNQILNQI